MDPELQTNLTALVDANIQKEEEVLVKAQQNLREHQGGLGNDGDMTIVHTLQREASQKGGILRRSREFLDDVKKSGPMEVIGLGADISLLFDGSPDQILLMRTPYELPDRTVITPRTPLAIAIRGLRAGDKISFTVNGDTHQVEITSFS